MTAVDFDPPRPESDPLALLQQWLAAAAASGFHEPEAMTLATATPDGAPSARTVLFKGLSGGRLRFFTNRQSRKGEELLANPRCALLFHWNTLARQVRVEGHATPLTDHESDAYYATRPRESRVGAWVSPQSRPIASHEALMGEVRALEARLNGADPARPPHWGGYGVAPVAWEFWVGRVGRLHERYRYDRDGAGWRLTLLGP